MKLSIKNLPRTICVERGSAVPSHGRAASESAAVAASGAVAAAVLAGAGDAAPAAHPQVVMVDQRALPDELAWISTSDWREVVDAVRELAMRGAPAIGVAGAASVMLAAFELAGEGTEGPGDAESDGSSRAAAPSPALFSVQLRKAAREIAGARPTAVNLSWGVNRALQTAAEALRDGQTPQEAAEALYGLSEALIAEDEAANRRIGAEGARLLRGLAREKGRPLSLLTHCNAGSLATAFFGTALGVVYAAAEQGLVERVYTDETRPMGQGARLTAWELARAGVPTTLICDSMAASLMAAGKVDAVVVGADRIAANGDVANKVGTLGLAALACHFDVPFFVAAPTSTLDAACATGADIPIEQRAAEEVLPRPIEGVEVLNPAFDVTPAALVDAVITEEGLWEPEEEAPSAEGDADGEEPPSDERGGDGEEASCAEGEGDEESRAEAEGDEEEAPCAEAESDGEGALRAEAEETPRAEAEPAAGGGARTTCPDDRDAAPRAGGLRGFFRRLFGKAES